MFIKAYFIIDIMKSFSQIGIKKELIEALKLQKITEPTNRISFGAKYDGLVIPQQQWAFTDHTASAQKPSELQQVRSLR